MRTEQFKNAAAMRLYGILNCSKCKGFTVKTEKPLHFNQKRSIAFDWGALQSCLNLLKTADSSHFQEIARLCRANKPQSDLFSRHYIGGKG